MVEVLGLPLPGVVGKADGAGAGLDVRAGLVEAHLALFTYAYHKEVKVTCNSVELNAVVAHLVLRNGSVRDMDVFLQDIHLVKEGLVDGVVAALEFISGSGIVLVNCYYLNVLE